MSKELKKDKEVIASMFNRIAQRYDLLNLLLSFGIDTLWRKKLIRFIMESKPQHLLDIACGTGDLTLIFREKGINVTGADISEKMLEVAIKKANKNSKNKSPNFILASADNLPFEDNSFDAVTISFGIRNFDNREAALKEIRRVLRVGGSLAILEFATPKNSIWRFVYNLYLKIFVPIAGRILSGDKLAYNYLSESIEAFPKYEAFCSEFEVAGFTGIKYYSLSGGISVLYTAYSK